MLFPLHQSLGGGRGGEMQDLARFAGPHTVRPRNLGLAELGCQCVGRGQVRPIAFKMKEGM